MAMPSAVIQSLDRMAGVLGVGEIGLWVTAGGAASFTDLGAITGLQIHHKETSKELEADNSLEPLDEYPTKRDITVEFVTLQTSLANLAMALGWAATRVSASAGVSATLPIGPLTTNLYYQVRISAPNLYMKPGSDVFTARIHTLWRCHQTADSPMKLVRGDHVGYKFMFKVLRDTTITASATTDQLGTYVDKVSP
jgi:hypothetical protein